MAFAPTFTGLGNASYAPTFTGGYSGIPSAGFGGYPSAGFGGDFGGYSAGIPQPGFGGYPSAGFGGYSAGVPAGYSVGAVHNPALVSQQVYGEQVVGYGTQIVEADIPIVSYQHVQIEQPIVYEQPVVYEVPQVVDIVQPVVQPIVYAPPPPPPRQRVSIVARSRDPRAQAAANELLNRFRGVSVAHPGDVQRLLDNSARTLSRALPNPVVA